MNASRSRLGRVALGALAALALGASQASAGNKPVAVGDYQADLLLDGGGNYTLGLFSVQRNAGKRSIVPTAGLAGIFYPDAGACDSLQLPLAGASVPISPTGRFKVKEKIPIGNEVLSIDWKGRWTKAKRVSGEITIKTSGCTSTEDWKGSKLP